MKGTGKRSYYETDLDDRQFGGASEVFEAEIEHISSWRGQEPRAGIALSGGGIRSASFCLGILQALAKGNWLREFDYLSTVSGGGYIGSSLSYLLHLSRTAPAGTVPKFDVSRDNFPYPSFPMVGTSGSGNDDEDRKKGALLRRLRQNAKYLTPGGGIGILSLLGVLLRNSFTSIVVHGSLFALVLLLLLEVGFLESSGTGTWPPALHMNLMMWTCATIFSAYVLLSGIYVFISGTFDAWLNDDRVYRIRRGYEMWVNVLLWATILTFAVAVLPWLYDLLRPQKIYSLYGGALSTFFGVLTSVWAFVQSSGVKKPKLPVGLLVAVASTLLLVGFLLMAFWVAVYLKGACEAPYSELILIAALLFAGWMPSVNYLSVHRYYRDRLMEVFMPDSDDIAAPEKYSGATYTGNKTMLGDLCGLGTPNGKPGKDNGPYHLICANVVLVSSKKPRYRGRGGDSFVFSRLFTGSPATGWVPTSARPGEGMTLATAMAISGAAVNPATGVGGEGITRQPVLSILMSMLNIRLGYWLGNPWRQRRGPGWEGTSLGQTILKPNMIYPGLWESLGRPNLREDAHYLLLTDGGHFENLGIYELLRRRLKLIIVCDGAADPDYSFGDLANALEKARADFGVIVEVSAADLADLIPQPAGKKAAGADGGEMPMAKRGYLAAPIKYAPESGSNGNAKKDEADENCGLLIYLTTTFFKELNASLYGYRKAHPDFPDEPTSDQFFDEKQFESYRELGFQTAWQMMTDFDGHAADGHVTLGGVELPRLKEAASCPDLPEPAQTVRQKIRGKAGAASCHD